MQVNQWQWLQRKQQNVGQERRNVDVSALWDRGNWSQRKETGGTYSITGHEPMLTTSENNYQRSLFSFQQSCINQTVTQSIWIHLKMKIRVIKKKKQIYVQLKLETRHWLSNKKPLTAPTTGSLWRGAVSPNHCGEVFPVHQSLLLL